MKKLIIILLSITLFYSCKVKIEDKQDIEKVETQDTLQQINTILRKEVENLKEQIKILERHTDLSQTNYKIFDSYDVELPGGRVVKLDHSHLEDGKSDLSDNYVSIRQENGLTIIKRDIDIDTYLNLSVGDSIQ